MCYGRLSITTELLLSTKFTPFNTGVLNLHKIIIQFLLNLYLENPIATIYVEALVKNLQPYRCRCEKRTII